MISSGGLTHRLDRLEKAGLISREKSPTDGRSSLVVLTDAGQKRAEDAFRADMRNELRHLDAMAPERREALAGLLRELALVIEEAAEANEPSA